MDIPNQRVIVIGGGFYGLSVALFLRDTIGIKDILVLDKEESMMSRASYTNQARVHNGYHYPRSILTASRSSANFPRFVEEYSDAVVQDFDKYYAIAKILSKVNARQFVNFSHKIGARIEKPDRVTSELFNSTLIEDVYKVQEYAFDSHILRDLLLAKINEKPGIMIRNDEEVVRLEQLNEGIAVSTKNNTYIADKVINSTYSQMNLLHRRSKLPLIALKHEIAEMALIMLPSTMDKFSVTVMDGPFFSIMPFPSKGLHTLSHVRYTPHLSWLDGADTRLDMQDTHEFLKENKFNSNYGKMYADVIRYIPALKDMKYVESIFEVKTVLQKSENDDSRPILFKTDFGIKGYACIMGGKLDNIYDVFDELEKFYEKED
ncbi:MAG: FAD-dependent oxidoreductase [Candidatus Microsaccharimonas sp.]